METRDSDFADALGYPITGDSGSVDCHSDVAAEATDPINCMIYQGSNTRRTPVRINMINHSAATNGEWRIPKFPNPQLKERNVHIRVKVYNVPVAGDHVVEFDEMIWHVIGTSPAGPYYTSNQDSYLASSTDLTVGYTANSFNMITPLSPYTYSTNPGFDEIQWYWPHRIEDGIRNQVPTSQEIPVKDIYNDYGWLIANPPAPGATAYPLNAQNNFQWFFIQFTNLPYVPLTAPVAECDVIINRYYRGHITFD